MGREGKNRPKENYFSNSFNTTTLKAKYSLCQKMNQLDTDMSLKRKHVFHIIRNLYSGVSV